MDVQPSVLINSLTDYCRLARCRESIGIQRDAEKQHGERSKVCVCFLLMLYNSICIGKAYGELQS